MARVPVIDFAWCEFSAPDSTKHLTACIHMVLAALFLNWTIAANAENLPTTGQAIKVSALKSAQAKKSASSPKQLKLASFAPSTTELLEDLGARQNLVGICKYCELSPLEGNSPVERIGDFNAANLERLIRLKPDAVLTVAGQDTLINALKKEHFSVITFDNNHLSDIDKNISKLGELTNRQKEAGNLTRSLEKNLTELKKICAVQKTKPTVFYCVWPQPLLTAGKNSFLNDSIEICGGENIANELPAPYPHFSLERLVLANPDVVIMPFEAKADDFVKRPPWNGLKAFKQKHVYFLPKIESDRLSRPSTRVTQGLYWLACKLHPEKTEQLQKWFAASQQK